MYFERMTNLHARITSNPILFSTTFLTGVSFSIGLLGCGGGTDGNEPQKQNPTDVPVAAAAPSARPAAAPRPAPTPAPPPTPIPSATSPVLTDAVFAPTSFWYSPIPANAPLHANSARFVIEFLRQKQAHFGTVNINTLAHASPVFIAAADAPTTKVSYSNCQNKAFPETALEAQWEQVPLPSYAVHADGVDREMTIYQPSTNTIWEFWMARKVSGQWQACWGGRMQATATNAGTWPHPYGTTATGLPFLGGQITAEELTRGEIRHAIGISLVETEASGVVSWPANRSDGKNPKLAPNRIPQGLRFRLDPGVNVDALGMSDAGKIIARAAQKYGFVVWDRAGAVSIRAQNPRSYTALGKIDPYIALFGGKPSYAILDGFPWERLQFMPMDYGKP